MVAMPWVAWAEWVRWVAWAECVERVKFYFNKILYGPHGHVGLNAQGVCCMTSCTCAYEDACCSAAASSQHAFIMYTRARAVSCAKRVRGMQRCTRALLLIVCLSIFVCCLVGPFSFSLFFGSPAYACLLVC